MGEKTKIELRVPNTLLDEFETAIDDDMKLENRSAALRFLMRKYVEETWNEWTEDTNNDS